MRTWLFPLFSSCINRTILVLTWSHPCKLSCPATSHSSLPLTLAPSLPPLAGSSRVYIYAACNCRARPAVHLKLAPPLPGVCLLSCSFPFCSPCTFVYLLSSNLYQSYHCTYFYKVSCASCTSMHALHLVHINSCTSTRAPLCVHLYACTAPREPHLVHLYVCTSRASLRVHLILCAPLRVHLISRAPLVHHLHSCTKQPQPQPQPQ